MAGFTRQVGVKHDMKLQVTQLIQYSLHITHLDGLRQFIDFLQGIRQYRFHGLLQVPWTTGIRITQGPHGFQQIEHFFHDLFTQGN